MLAAARALPVAVVLAVLLTAGGGVRAQEADGGEDAGSPVIDLEREPASRWLGVHHYGVFRGETRVGWLRRALERVEHDGEPAVARTLQSFVDVAGDGNAIRTEERAVYRTGEPQLLVEIERRTEHQARERGRRATRAEGRFDVVTTRDGDEVTGAVAAFDLVLADELVTERLVAAARAAESGRASAIAVALDLTRMRPVRRKLAVRDTEQAADGSTLYHVCVAQGDERWSDPVVVDADGAIVRGTMGGGLRLRRMSEEEARTPLGRGSVETADRIRMDARLGDPLTLRELEISMPAPAAGRPAPFPETGRQTVTVEGDRVRVTVRVEKDAGEVADADRAAALEPSPTVDSDDPAVVAAVDKILAGTSRPPVRVARLLAFTASHLVDEVVMGEPKASELLRSRRGDCTEHTRLFVALCRAAGIPAREVTGLIWIDDEQQTFGWHAWAEVELAGRWRPVDPTQGRTPAHAAHLRVNPAARYAGVFDGVRFVLLAAVR